MTGETALTATVQDGSGYVPGSTATASTRIRVADPAVTASFEQAAYTFDEAAGDATLAVILRTATGVPVPHADIFLSINTAIITDGASPGGVDFENPAGFIQFVPSDFTADGATFTARKEVTLAIVDDAIDEPDETLNMLLEPGPSTSELVAFRQPDGTACPGSGCEATVTIVDNDASTDATLSGLAVNDGSTDLLTFVPGTTTYTAMVANDVETLTFTETKNDADASVAYLDSDGNPIADADTAAGHQVPLDVGANVITVRVMAADDTTTLDYTVTVNRAASSATLRLHPTAPTNFTATVGNAQVALAWKAPALDSGVTRHEYRYKTSGGYPPSWTEIANSAPAEANEDAFTVTMLTNEVAHTFQLRAVGGAGAPTGTSATAGPVTPTPGICDRTQRVHQNIVALLSGVDDCAAVTVADLAGISSLSVGGQNGSLKSGDFAGLTALRELYLDNNGLTALDAGVFDGLTALRELYLHNNELSTLDAGVFAGLTALRKLYLNSNELSTLDAGVFAGLTALEFLELPDNGLTTLDAGVFDGLTLLISLVLSDNELATLPDDVFEPLIRLLSLNLSNNSGEPFAPTADALPDDGTVSNAGGTVTLDGSGSDGGPWGTTVVYTWALTDPASGVTVMFDDTAIATPVVTIPALTVGTELTFTLTVTPRGGNRHRRQHRHRHGHGARGRRLHRRDVERARGERWRYGPADLWLGHHHLHGDGGHRRRDADVHGDEGRRRRLGGVSGLGRQSDRRRGHGGRPPGAAGRGRERHHGAGDCRRRHDDGDLHGDGDAGGGAADGHHRRGPRVVHRGARPGDLGDLHADPHGGSRRGTGRLGRADAGQGPDSGAIISPRP